MFAGFLPNRTYDVQIDGSRGGAPMGPFWRQLTTDPSGAFTTTFNIGFLQGDLVWITVENVISEQEIVTC